MAGKLIVLILASLSLLSISSASILVLLSKAPSYACAFWRLAISTALLLIYGFARYRRIVLVEPAMLRYTVLSGIFLSLHFLLWMESLFHVPVAISTTIVVSYPLFSVVVDRYLLSEKITKKQILGLTIGFIGILLFLHPDIARGSIYGVLLSLGGALAATAYFSIGKFVRKRAGLLEYTIPTYMVAATTTLLYILGIRGNLYNYDIESYAFFLLLAVIPMIGGHTVMNYLLRYMKTSSATSIALGEPVGASILAYIFLGQELGFLEVVLIAIVLSSVFMVITEELRD